MPKAINDFISQFTDWAYSGRLRARDARRLPSLLRRIVQNELPARDTRAHVLIRDLANSEGLSCRYDAPNVWSVPDGRKRLLVGAVYPYWRRGWTDVCSTEELKEVISSFFHFASQYVARSRAVSIIGAVALTYQRACPFIGGDRFQEMTIGAGMPLDISAIKKQVSDDYPDRQATGARERVFVTWAQALNALDPYVNRAIVHYVRTIELDRSGYFEETVTALDRAVEVGRQFVRDRLRISTADPFMDLASGFSLDRNTCESLKRLNRLRNYFGGHPSLSKWWDAHELYEDLPEQFFRHVGKMLWRLARAEQTARVVEPNPTSWSEWFARHAMLLWDSAEPVNENESVP